MVRILGVDPGSRFCGYGVVEVDAPGSVRYLECGVLTAPPRASMEQRLAEISRSLYEVIREFQPVEVAVEDVFSHVNLRSSLALAQARGMVLAVAGISGLEVHAYAPAVVKKAVTGRGRATKDQVARMVQVLVGLRRLPPADAADALALAILHAQRVDPPRPAASLESPREPSTGAVR